MTSRLHALASYLETDPDNLVLQGHRLTDLIRRRALSGCYYRVLTPDEAGVEALARFDKEFSHLSDFMQEVIDKRYAERTVGTSEGRGLLLSDYDNQEGEYVNENGKVEYYIYRVKDSPWD